MEHNRKKLISAIISIFVVGGGQLFQGRIITGLWFIIVFYGTILVTKILWIALTPGFWVLFGAWIVFWLFNIYDAYRGLNYAVPPCQKKCPAGVAPWYYINHIASNGQKYPFIPFFKILGLICPAPCEDNCTRRAIDEAVSISILKHAVETEPPAKPEEERKEKVAIIGAGPCGLTAGYELRKMGYQVTIYEKDKSPGGVLVHYIPEFRLPKTVVEEEIEQIKKSGIVIKTGIAVGSDINLAELIAEHNAIFIATGAGKSETLHVEGEELALSGLDILRKIKQGERIKLGKVAVIGGGNTAFDVARSLLRFGNEVAIYYRRAIEYMPAEKENKIEADEEGIKIYLFTTPVRITKDKVVMAKTHCAEGRHTKVEIVPNTEFEIDVNSVISAIGQTSDTGFLSEYIAVDKSGRIVTKNGRTSNPKIFAGGDAVLGPQTLAHAVGHGISIARQIDKFLSGSIFPARKLIEFQTEPIIWQIVNTPRIKVPHRNIQERIKDFDTVESIPEIAELKQEARRCLVCPLRYKP